MANTTDSVTLIDGPKKITRKVVETYVDTASATVVLADASAITGPDQVNPCDYFSILCIEYDVSPGVSALVKFNATSDDEGWPISGQGKISFEDVGGIVDPKSTGTNGDIEMLYAGAAAGDYIGVKIKLKKKQN